METLRLSEECWWFPATGQVLLGVSWGAFRWTTIMPQRDVETNLRQNHARTRHNTRSAPQEIHYTLGTNTKLDIMPQCTREWPAYMASTGMKANRNKWWSAGWSDGFFGRLFAHIYPADGQACFGCAKTGNSLETLGAFSWGATLKNFIVFSTELAYFNTISHTISIAIDGFRRTLIEFDAI